MYLWSNGAPLCCSKYFFDRPKLLRWKSVSWIKSFWTCILSATLPKIFEALSFLACNYYSASCLITYLNLGTLCFYSLGGFLNCIMHSMISSSSLSKTGGIAPSKLELALALPDIAGLKFLWPGPTIHKSLISLCASLRPERLFSKTPPFSLM